MSPSTTPVCALPVGHPGACVAADPKWPEQLRDLDNLVRSGVVRPNEVRGYLNGDAYGPEDFGGSDYPDYPED